MSDDVCLVTVVVSHTGGMTTPDPSRYRDLETLYPGLSEEQYAALEGF